MTIPSKTTLPYRASTQAIITDDQGRILLVQSQSYKQDEWNFPGGGVEDQETPQQAIARELTEELGTSEFKIVKQLTPPYSYDWPPKHIQEYHQKTGKWFRGQTKHVFHVSMTDPHISLQTQELRQYRWVTQDQLPTHLKFPNQWQTAQQYLSQI